MRAEARMTRSFVSLGLVLATAFVGHAMGCSATGNARAASGAGGGTGAAGGATGAVGAA